MDEDIRDVYIESLRVALNLAFWEDVAINVFGIPPDDAKDIAVDLNEIWDKEHSVQLKTE